MDSVIVYLYDVVHQGVEHSYAEAVVRDEPRINASASRRLDSGADARPLLVDAWNRAHPEDVRRAHDFIWEAPPVGWVNPNTEPVDPKDI